MSETAIVLSINGIEVRAESRADEPRLRDVDIARRAGLAKPSNIRQTIRQALKSGLLNGDDTRTQSVTVTTPRKDGRVATTTAAEYWLTETGAMLLLTQMRTPAAVAFTRTVVETCREAVRQLREPARPDVSVLHSPAIGDHIEKREMLGHMCKAVADVQKCRVVAVHGAIRSRYGVNSVCRISVMLWEVVRKDLMRAISSESPLMPRLPRPKPKREDGQTKLFEATQRRAIA